MGAKQTVTILAALLLWGCTPQAVPPLGIPDRSPLTRTADSQPQAPTVQVSPPEPATDGSAMLKLSIRWPRPRGFGVAALPLSVQSLRFAIEQGDRVLASKVVTREPGAESAQVSFRLKAATDVTLLVRGYREAAPVEGAAVAIAEGRSEPFSLVPSRYRNVSLSLKPLFPPSVESLSSPYQGEEATVGTYYAGEGDEILLTGSNFLAGATPSVYFERTNASLLDSPPVTATRLSDTQLKVRVPAQAASGPLYVVVDGIGTLTPRPLWIPTVSLDAPKQPYDPLPADSRMVPDEASYTGTELPRPIPGSTITLTASVSWALGPGRGLGEIGAPPLVTPAWIRTSEWAGWYHVTGRYTLYFVPRPLDPATEYFATKVHAQVGSVKSNALSLIVANVCKAYACP